MKVVWASHRDVWGPQAGGAELSAVEICKGLTDRGHRVRLYSVAPGKAPWHFVDGGIEVVRVPTNTLAHAAWGPYRWWNSTDVVVEDLAHVVPFGGRLVSGRPGVVSFRHLHRRTLPGQVGPVAASLLTRIERMYSTIYEGWTFVTESLSSSVDLRELGVPATDIKVIPPGVDTTLFRPGARSSRPTLIYFGGLRAYKRPEHAVRLLAGLRALGDDVVLEVVGGGPGLLAVRTESLRQSMDPFVTFTGRLSREALAARVARAWLNVHCSVSEGWCFSAIEAAASGVPTVAYSIPGLRDSVAEGQSGRLVPDGDLDALVETAHKMLQDIDRWSVGSRKHAMTFNWEPSITAWEKVLAEVLAERHGA